jgi:hypothetical protein
MTSSVKSTLCIGCRSANDFLSFSMFPLVSSAQTSRSRVTVLDPCSTAAMPPTMTKSMPASSRRCNRPLLSFTQLPARLFRGHDQCER